MLPLMNMVLLTTPKTYLLGFDGFQVYKVQGKFIRLNMPKYLCTLETLPVHV
jgi:hypothetical protein